MGPKLSDFLSMISSTTGIPISVSKAYYPQIVLLAGITEVLGSVLVLLNIPSGVTLLMLFLVPTTAVMHNFWALPEGSQAHQAELVHFMKNLAILGGLLTVQGAMGTKQQRKEKTH